MVKNANVSNLIKKIFVIAVDFWLAGQKNYLKLMIVLLERETINRDILKRVHKQTKGRCPLILFGIIAIDLEASIEPKEHIEKIIKHKKLYSREVLFEIATAIADLESFCTQNFTVAHLYDSFYPLFEVMKDEQPPEILFYYVRKSYEMKDYISSWNALEKYFLSKYSLKIPRIRTYDAPPNDYLALSYLRLIVKAPEFKVISEEEKKDIAHYSSKWIWERVKVMSDDGLVSSMLVSEGNLINHWLNLVGDLVHRNSNTLSKDIQNCCVELRDFWNRLTLLKENKQDLFEGKVQKTLAEYVGQENMQVINKYLATLPAAQLAQRG